MGTGPFLEHFLGFIGQVGLFEFIQIPILLTFMCIAFRNPAFGEPAFTRIEASIRPMADRPFLAAGVIALTAVILRALVMPITGTPEATLDDDCSIILQADTYLSGHLANHIKLSPDFESVYILLAPSYSSMYPVLRSFPLLLGKVIGLDYWAGVWAVMAGLCAATYWMLKAWIEPRYAMAGALLVLVRFGLFSTWENAYWGAAFTALGGLLMLGGYGRLVRRPTPLAGLCIGLGVLILMTTRPYEGLLFAAPCGAALIVRFVVASPRGKASLLAPGLLTAAFVGAGAALTAAHDRAVTGDWKTAPYSVYRKTTAETPPFLFEKPLSPTVPARYVQTRIALDREGGDYMAAKGAGGMIRALIARLFNYWDFYVGFALTIPLIVGLPALRRHVDVAACGLVLLLGLALETWGHAHYAAPAFGVVMLVIMTGFRRLRAWSQDGRPVGKAMSRVIPAALVIGLPPPVAFAIIIGHGFSNAHLSAPCCAMLPPSIHGSVERVVERSGGAAIVIVDSGPGAPRETVVYNHADVPSERIIWVNKDPLWNDLTIRRFPGRRLWRLTWLPAHAACLTPDEPLSPLVKRAAASGGWIGAPGPLCPGGLTHAAWL